MWPTLAKDLRGSHVKHFPAKAWRSDFQSHSSPLGGAVHWIVYLKNSCVEVLNPSTSKCDLIWKQGCCRVVELGWGQIGVGWAPNPIWLASLWRGWIWTDMCTGRTTPCEAGVMMPQAEELPGAQRGNPSFLSASRGSTTLLRPWSWTSSLQHCDTITFCWSSHPVCGPLLQLS